MSSVLENLLFVQALADQASQIRALLADGWPAFQAQLRGAIEHLLKAEDERQALKAVDEIFLIGLASPADELFRELMTLAASNAGRLSYDTRSTQLIDPTSEPIPKGVVGQADLAAAAQRLQVALLAGPDADERAINAWIPGLSADEPLQLGRIYQLAFDVDRPRAEARAIAGGVGELVRQLAPSQEQVDVLVVIATDDFAIHGEDQQTLIVPRSGASPHVVMFTIEPKQPGPGVIKALLFANGRVFQKLTITLQVGTPAERGAACLTQSSGLTLESALAQPARQQAINLTIVKKDTGYQCILQWAGVTRAFLNLSETQIAELIARARDELKAIVYTRDGDRYVYQGEDTTIPAEIHTAALKSLARLGYYLYQKLFYTPGNGPDAHAMGALLRRLSQQHPLRIAIVAERFVFPWALLYDRDPIDLSEVDPEGFWGFKHIVEHMPEFSGTTPVQFAPQIAVRDNLQLSFICNTTIDTQLPRAVVQTQRELLSALPGVQISEHRNCQDLYDLLNNSDTPAQLLYFYCHAVSQVPGDRGGVAGSKLLLSDGPVHLADLDVFAPTHRPALKQAPLVFLNACQSAELSPYLYDGLVPYLIARGARGVLGTEVDTPALFAAEFAQELIRRFSAGEQALGPLLLNLRRAYLLQKNNIMGLVYALYSSGDIVIRRG
jgi:hypothetical protein